MKKSLLFMLFFLSLAAAKAQDKIITIQNDTIECLIISVGTDRINYEQKVSENVVAGKSIAVSEVLHYFRTGQRNALGGIYLSKPRMPKPDRRYLLNIQGGMSRSLTDFDAFTRQMTGSGITAAQADDYTGKLKNGYQVNADFHYLLTNFIGIGAGYNLFQSGSEGNFLINGFGGMNLPMYVNLGLQEKIYTHFAGPSVLFQQLPGRNGKLKISETLSPGMVIFRNESRGNEYQIFWGENEYYNGQPPQYYEYANSVTKGTAFGARGGVSLEYAVAPQLSAGLAGSFIWAKLKKASLKSFNNELNDQELEKAMDVSHFDYGFTLRYSF